jgi:hypothetical protein
MIEELQEATRNANGKCISAKLITATLAGTGYGLTDKGIILYFFYYVFQISFLCNHILFLVISKHKFIYFKFKGY